MNGWDIVLCVIAGILLFIGIFTASLNGVGDRGERNLGFILIGVAVGLICLVIFLPEKSKYKVDENATVHIDNGNIKTLFPKKEPIRNINDPDLMDGYVIKFTPDSLFVFSATEYVGGAAWDSNGIRVDSILRKDFKQ